VLRALKRQALHEQGGKCRWCGDPLTIEDATADHLVPRYAGGATRHGNIVAACAHCNSTRNIEANHYGGQLNVTVGDPTPRSPFEVLANWVGGAG
jgi:5-methylcytosine-specific restriction endonuclease McrA